MAGHDDWERHWERYAESARRNPAQRMRHAIIARLLVATKSGGRPMRLLDLGSGQGDLVALLKPHLPDAEMVGVELSQSGVDISRRKVPGAVFLAADLFHPPRELSAYMRWATDAVCSEVLEHVDDPTAFMRAASGLFAPGARVIVTVPGGPMSAFDRHIGHRRHFDRATISRALVAAGFEIERVFRAGVPFFNLYRLLVIARGERLAADVTSERPGAGSRLAGVAMAVFRALFAFNLRDAPGGWQMIAVARWPGQAGARG